MTIEKLAYLIQTECTDGSTLGEMSRKYSQPMQRIMDAIDVLKIRKGESTQIPPVPWEDQ